MLMEAPMFGLSALNGTVQAEDRKLITYRGFFCIVPQYIKCADIYTNSLEETKKICIKTACNPLSYSASPSIKHTAKLLTTCLISHGHC